MITELFPQAARRARDLGITPEEYMTRRENREKFCGHKEHKRWVSVDAFSRDRNAPDGLNAYCKDCSRKAQKAAKDRRKAKPGAVIVTKADCNKHQRCVSCENPLGFPHASKCPQEQLKRNDAKALAEWAELKALREKQLRDEAFAAKAAELRARLRA